MRRYFKVETIKAPDSPNERRETTYDTAQTAREMLLKRGVHLAKDEQATSNHRYVGDHLDPYKSEQKPTY
jgi:hypothetical protein